MGGLGSYSDFNLTFTGELALEMEHEERPDVSPRPSSLNYALPFELLGEIFSHISEDPLDLRYAILVCRSWHNAVVHHANLWTNIILGYTFLTRFRGARLHHGDAFVRLCISRSSPLPLHISVNGPNCQSLYESVGGVPYDDCFSLVQHILDSNPGEPENLFRRCRSLNWTFIRQISDVNLAAWIFISASFPALEYMTIEDLYISGEHPRIGSPRFPRLKEVTLIEHSETYTPPFFHDDDFANAETLTFVVTSRWMGFDATCIGRFRNIRILILKGDDLYGDEDVEALDDKPAELSLLETLSLYGKVQYQILNMIRPPGLRKLEIEESNTKGWHSLIASNLVHLVGSLERLCVSLNEDMHETFWVEELERLIAKAPPLVSVWVSPWMVRCMVGKEWRSKLHVMDPK
jgi:hypothetical protein